MRFRTPGSVSPANNAKKMARSSNVPLFVRVLFAVITLDVFTKLLAVTYLPLRVPQELFGQEWMRLTLVYNRGAAFGLNFFGHDLATRIVFTVLTIVALLILYTLFRQTRDGDFMRVLALALVSGGAIGNLIDRVRSSAGVVDFLDFGIGASRWPTFNVADMAVSSGAVMLAVVLWREEGQQKREAPAAVQSGPSLTPGSGGNAI
jgi:signal peptidase II